MTPDAAGRRGAVLPAILFAVLVAVVYANPLFSRRNFTGRDLLAYNLPLEKSIHDAYARGRLPVWTPEVSGGRPLMPNPNTGSLYPVRPLLSRVPFPLAMRLYPVLHWAAAGIGVLLLASTLSASAGAAWVGAAAYAFSGVVVSEVFYPHIQPGMTLLPWLLWAVARPWRRPAGQTLTLAILLTLDLLAADVFTVALGIFGAGLWIALETPGTRRKSAFSHLATALGLALLAALPQILATALWIPETNRAVLGMRLSEATRYSVSPWRLAELVVPYPFGETWRLTPSEVWGWGAFGNKAMGLFSTLYAGALAAMAVGTMWKSRRPGARFARALLAAALLAAVLPSLLPRSLGHLVTPVALRNPEKFAVAAALALALLAALALDVYRQEGRGPRGGFAVAAALALAAALTALSPSPSRIAERWLAGGAPLPQFARAELPRALAEAGLLWVATLIGIDLARRRAAAARGAALALLTLVPIAATRRIPEVSTEQEAFGPTRLARRIAKADTRGEYRTLGESIYASPAEAAARLGLGWAELPRESWIYYTPIFWGRGLVFNYDFDAGDLARVESLRRLSGLAAASPDGAVLFENLCLKFGVRPRGQPAVPGFAPVGGSAAQEWDELAGAQPDIRLATRWKEEPGALQAAADLPGLARGELLLETGRRADGSAPEGTLRIVEKSPERLRLATEAPQPTWLFVLRAFWNHRTVRIDGREVETVPAYLAYTAVPVPAGRHAIDWRERVPGGESSRLGPLAAGMAAALLLVSGSRRKEP
ncbi:MAG: hypothetical protein ACM3SU_08145 [Acidobacteriota bacterium]